MSKESSNPLTSIALCIFILHWLVIPSSASGGRIPANGHPASTLVAPPWRHTLGLHRVRQTHLDIYSGYRKKFSSPQGIVAVKHAFNDEDGPADDDELTVYGLNSGASEIIYNTSRYSLGFFSSWEGGGFVEPIGIAADRGGWVAVSDRDQDQIIYLQNESNALRYVRAITLAETGLPLADPSGLAIESERLYAADTGNDRIVILNREGELTGAVGGIPGRWEFNSPFDVAVITESEWNHYGSRFMIVSDSLNQRLSKLSVNGIPLAVQRFHEISGDIGGFFFVAVDYYSNVYASNTVGGCIYKFDRHLNYLTRFGCESDDENELEEPRGIAIYRRFGQVFVAERSGASYYWVGTDVLNLSCQARTREGSTILEVRFSLTEQSRITIQLEGEGGEPRILVENMFMEPGVVTKTFYGEDLGTPESLANCECYVTVSAKPTYSSKRYLTVLKKTPVRLR